MGRNSKPIQRGFLVAESDRVPAIGDKGVSQQMMCPLTNGKCAQSFCMFWQELFDHTKEPPVRVGHCVYYWGNLQLVDIKQQLIELNKQINDLKAGGKDATPS